ncbi:hypothetical protein JTE90_028977 [Oedothorax gibbosus]|uniref:Uncharacterized protein n=1 Tax=Oedothorax gibbosus TaxID=931172 RepID=A0AAV6VK30_9ARAC|nr:hypothetical protein JTE90_028977 [Oedothorax gibbosus]
MAKKFSQDTCLSNVIDLTYEESQSLLSDGKLKSKTENCNVLEILQNDTQGLIVLNNYKSVKTLSHSLRKKMVDVLVNFCIKTYGRLTNADFEILSILIVEEFPSEDQEIYYVPPCKDGQGPKISSGKIPNKYRNLVRLLKDAEVIPSKPKTICGSCGRL